jgi:hypothetical protein
MRLEQSRLEKSIDRQTGKKRTIASQKDRERERGIETHTERRRHRERERHTHREGDRERLRASTTLRSNSGFTLTSMHHSNEPVL